MTDYNTLQKKRNIIVGCFVVIGIVVFILFIFMFGEAPFILTKHQTFYVFSQFPSAQGIQKNTPINYCGFHIGKVFKVEPPTRLVNLDTGETMNQVKVGLAIENKYENKIPLNAKVRVMTRSMASSYIEFMDVDEDVTGFINRSTTTLQGDVGSTSEFIPKEFQDKFDNIADQISTLASSLNKIVGDEDNRENIKLTLARLAKATKQADETFKSIQSFTESSKSTLSDVSLKMSDALASIKLFTESGKEAVDDLSGQVAGTLDSVKDFTVSGRNTMDDVSEQIADTLKELRVTLIAINSGKGSASKFINDPALYDNLVNASEELELAVSQLKHLALDAREKGIKIAF